MDIWSPIVAAWVAVGVVTALVMGRRGFSAWAWLFIGVVLGPLVVPLAVASAREGRPVMLERLAEGRPGGGDTHVLIGIDGSDAASGAAQAGVAVVGDALGHCTLAGVIDRDTARAPAALRVERQRLQEAIDAAAGTISRVEPDVVLLEGKPADALTRFATEGDYGLIVVGRRGRGATKSMLGSTADALARGGDIPVMIV
jgi:nucleotide-binding universal stress UspA family protein